MHSLDDVQYTLDVFSKIAVKLKNGAYKGAEIENKAIE